MLLCVEIFYLGKRAYVEVCMCMYMCMCGDYSLSTERQVDQGACMSFAGEVKISPRGKQQDALDCVG